MQVKFLKFMTGTTIFLLTLFPIKTMGYQVGAEAAICIEVTTGEILFAQNIDSQLSMASTTKIMTALLTLEQENIYDMFTVDSDAIMVEGSSMGLRADDQVSMYALAGGMLTASGNDAANAAAVKIAGSNQEFAVLMNERAKEIGMTNTNFVTPSGLDDQYHYSTAYDMALLGAYAIQNPDFLAICSQTSAKLYFGNPPYERTLSNHNKLLSYYPSSIGIKTGFTQKSGRCLVSAAEQDGVQLVVVTLNCGDDWNIHQQIYNNSFEKVTSSTYTHPDVISIPVTNGEKSAVDCETTNNFTYVSIEDTVQNVESKVFSENFLYAPIKKGDNLGKIVYYINGEVCSVTDIIACQDVAACISEDLSLATKIQLWWYDVLFALDEKFSR